MTGPDHADRRARVRGSVEVDVGPGVAILVTSPASVRWATGFTGSAGALLVGPEGAVLITDDRYVGRAAQEAPGLDVEVDRDVVAAAIRSAVSAGARRLVFEGDHLSHRMGTSLQTSAAEADLVDAVSVAGLVEGLRTTKDAHELALLADACARTEAALDALLADGLVGRSEVAIATWLEDRFRASGAQVAFPSIVASGPNGAVPHHAPGGRVIEAGDLVTIDCGALVGGYHADTTRTVAAGRAPDDAVLMAAFEAVAAAQAAGVASLHAGVAAADVDAACRDLLHERGLGEAFVHGTGHGVGLEIHEHPILTRTATATLPAGAAVTVEPGVYLPGRGGVRIEDTLVVTDTGARRLTTSPHDLVVA